MRVCASACRHVCVCVRASVNVVRRECLSACQFVVCKTFIIFFA